MKKLLALFVVVLGFSAVSFGQANIATASSSATIVTALNVQKTTDMNFGNILRVNATGGTVVLSPAGSPTPSSADLTVLGGAPTAAVFTVNGTANSTYSITTNSADITLTGAGTAAGDDMKLGTFTLAATTGTVSALTSGSATGVLLSGTAVLNMGATLTVKGTQLPGVYTNATGLIVTVNYN
ncbi:MAG: DUF4402 domain-containing protein [Mariniphaga sp.]|nr:DUF4402 domain-containing protein [Mariniphaga sp.]